ncbi:UNVERIFIED_CONTAM: hypothetical protein GTU68_040013 [Idotea baltica]|nr:hypothetical protein [Idotea baltica]
MKDKDRAKEVEFFCLLACIYNESFYFAFNIMREIVIKSPENNRSWNLLCFIISKADDFRHNRFLLRLTHKHPDSLPLTILNGHNCLVSGTYKFSVAEYSQAFKNASNDPLVPLMLGLIYTHMACQKFSGNKNSLVVTATAFLTTYLEMRSECQESYYNLGRAMHQLNLLPQAVFYYKKALSMPVPDTTVDGPDLNLVREIVFNLSLIYKKSGNLDLVRYYINKYIRYD